MKRKNKYAIIALAFTVTGIFTGCKSTELKETTIAETKAEVTSESTTASDITAMQPETADEREMVSVGEEYGNPVSDIKKMFEDFGSLMGQDDDKVTALLGEGTMVPEKGQEVSLRSYNMKIFDTEAATDVYYDQGKVSSFQIVFAESDFSAYEAQITKVLGTPEKEEEKSGESNRQAYKWNMSDCDIELVSAFDTVSIQMFQQQ